ncbi:MAG: NADH-quinone oxidoreductase subunit NuoG [Psychrobium sp.]|nr:NADH-quinone oxidoreductase subunit NuoG [Psychrobium sp.]
MAEIISICIDGKNYNVPAGNNLLATCLELNIDLSYFCWHPSLGSVGSCRQCAVIVFQNELDTRGRLVMACMTPLSDNMIISINSQKAKDFRATNIEALMTNHPHDCPVCEEGGDCHLQDMTLMSEHITRRYEGEKRTHTNQYLGPLINHEMNRCIGCYRCVRFYRDYCNDDDFNVFGSKNQVYFGRAQSGILQSNFSGNLSEVCPTGVFTDKTFSEHYSRKWDLQSSATICQHCSLGCHTYTGSYNKRVRRISNRQQQQINGDFLCDKGRYSYQYNNSEQRISTPTLRNKANKTQQSISSKQTLTSLNKWLVEADGSIVALGSSRSSIENNFAIKQLLQQHNSSDFYSDNSAQQLALQQQQIDFYQQQKIVPCSLSDLETSDCVLVVGENLDVIAPRLALSLRQMVRNKGIKLAANIGIAPWMDLAVRNVTQQLTSPLFILSNQPSSLADISRSQQAITNTQQVNLLQLVKCILNGELSDKNEQQLPLAQEIANSLSQATNPAIIHGSSSTGKSQSLVQDIYKLLALKTSCLVHYILPSANALALAIIATKSHDLDAMVAKIKRHPPKLLLIVESDLSWLLGVEHAQSLYQQTFERIEHVVVLDHLLTDTAQMADLLLPSASSAEQQGCWLNSQGLLQLSQANLPPLALSQPSWLWCKQTSHLSDEQQPSTLHHYQQLLQDCAEQYPLLQTIIDYVLPPSTFKQARQSIRASGRTAINANIDVKEYAPKTDELTNSKFSMEGVAPFRQQHTEIQTPSGAYIWQPKWNSGQSINKGNTQREVKLLSIFADKSNSTPNIETATTINNIEDLAYDNLHFSEMTIVPLNSFYDDNELSHYCPSLNELMVAGAVKLNQQSADMLGWQDSQQVSLHVNDQKVHVTCHIDKHCSDNCLLLDKKNYRHLSQSPPANVETDTDINDQSGAII